MVLAHPVIACPAHKGNIKTPKAQAVKRGVCLAVGGNTPAKVVCLFALRVHRENINLMKANSLRTIVWCAKQASILQG
jgi:hypothetical protein